MDSKGLNFDELADEITLMSAKAQTTFLFKLMHKLGPGIVRTAMKYCCMRLDSINSQLPLDDPNRVRYEERMKLQPKIIGTMSNDYEKGDEPMFESSPHFNLVPMKEQKTSMFISILDPAEVIRIFEANEQL